MAVLNKHKLPGGVIPPGAVYIGRGSMWGNPYVIGKDGDRDDVCEQHTAALHLQLERGHVTVEQLASLHGKDLVCFCAPLRCHGDTLVEAAAWAHDQLNQQGNTQ
jgi:hypothetical protein